MLGSSYRLWRAGLGMVAALGLIGAAAPGALAASCSSCTWSGPSGNWSDGANWEGGNAPSASVTSITFPGNADFAWSSVCCNTATSVDDIPTGVSTGSFTIDNTTSYDLQGNGVTIGSGGLQTTSSNCGFNPPGVPTWGPDVELPITLGARQSWAMTFNGCPYVDRSGYVTFAAPISGSSPLTVNMSGGAEMTVGRINVDALSFVGNGSPGSGSVMLQDEPHSSPAGLNPGSSTPVSFAGGVDLDVGNTAAASSAPLSMSGGLIALAGPMVFTVNGAFSLDSGSSYDTGIFAAGTTAGSDYSELSASGDINLGGAQLGLGFGQVLVGDLYGNNCPTLHVGDVDTLIKTSGSLIGTFANAPNGSTVQLYCPPDSGTEPTLRISYTTNSVTATVLTTGSGASGPSSQPMMSLDKIRAHRKFAKVTVTCTGPTGSFCRDAIRLTVVETIKHHHLIAVTDRKKTTVIGRLTVTLTAGQTKTVTVWLNRAGRHLGMTRRSFKAKLQITQSGQTVATGTVQFKKK